MSNGQARSAHQPRANLGQGGTPCWPKCLTDPYLTAEHASVPADAECSTDDEEPGSPPGAAVAISEAKPASPPAVQPSSTCSPIMLRFGNFQAVSSRAGFSVATTGRVQAVVAVLLLGYNCILNFPFTTKSRNSSSLIRAYPLRSAIALRTSNMIDLTVSASAVHPSFARL
jgi:hypothetical protein